MAWASLSTTLGNKPHVLAGPLLRRVTTEEATVWLALRKPGTVDLTIYDGNAAILQGRRHTVAIGRNLHIVAVTADKALPPFTGTMAEGKIYQYDLTFAYDDHLSETLASATGGASLAYAPYTRPSFCLPPSNLNALRILHGSCRIPHGNGPDTLPIIDDLILQMAANPDMRPHQLLMTGDQIYADDVGYAMSMMVNDAAEALLGWSEVVPINLPPFGPTKVADLSPALREHALAETAGFTSEDLVGHLVGLGEYLAMYLFVWSDVPWPATGTALPAFAEVANYFASREPGIFSELGYRQVRYEDAKAIDAQTARTQDFRSKLGAVRRALANIPSYMIFDDHEVTDDWNMTRRICTGIYGSDLGLRVVQNALTAYAVCQHWGNVPAQFDTRQVHLPGAKLLLQLDGLDAAGHVAAGPALRHLLGIHDPTALAARHPFAVFHDADALEYHYTVEGPSHQVIVTDSRSWRSFPRGAEEGGDLIPASELQRQIAGSTPTGDRIPIVVLTTNAPPVIPIRMATVHSDLANTFEHYPDVFEAWELPSAATDRLYRAISEKLPLASGRRRGAALILSGDVHFSFASRLLYSGTARFEDPASATQGVRAVFAQLVASSFRKQTGSTLGFHTDGYLYSPNAAAAHFIPNTLEVEYYIGWNVPRGTSTVVGRTTGFGGWKDLAIKGPRTFRVEPTIAASRPVDYGYRLDYLSASNESAIAFTTRPVPPVPPGATLEERMRAIGAFHAATGNYRLYKAGNTTKRQVVGTNNLGEITFDGASAAHRSVNHTLRWFDPKTRSPMFTTYVVSLDPDDPNFPMPAGVP